MRTCICKSYNHHIDCVEQVVLALCQCLPMNVSYNMDANEQEHNMQDNAELMKEKKKVKNFFIILHFLSAELYDVPIRLHQECLYVYRPALPACILQK